MRLNEFEDTEKQRHPENIDVHANELPQTFVVYTRVNGLVTLPYLPDDAWIQVDNNIVNETGSSISVEPLGMGDGYLIMADCFGLIPVSINSDTPDKTIKNNILNGGVPILCTNQGQHHFDEVDLNIGSSYLVDYANQTSMMIYHLSDDVYQGTGY